MATIARMMVELEITKLMKPYSEKPPTERTLKLSTTVEVYSDTRTPYGQIVGITIPPVSEIPLLKVGIYNPFNRYKPVENYTLFSMGNFNEDVLKIVLNNARESMASAGK